MGSFLRTRLYNCELSELKAIKSCPNIYSAALDGKILDNSFEFPSSGIILIGNESKGVRAEYDQYIDQKIKIASHTDSKAESLNAAIATAIILSKL